MDGQTQVMCSNVLGGHLSFGVGFWTNFNIRSGYLYHLEWVTSCCNIWSGYVRTCIIWRGSTSQHLTVGPFENLHCFTAKNPLQMLQELRRCCINRVGDVTTTKLLTLYCDCLHTSTTLASHAPYVYPWYTYHFTALCSGDPTCPACSHSSLSTTVATTSSAAVRP